MRNDALIMHNRPNLEKPRLVMGLSGWMDGGEVSTGSIKYLVNKLDSQKTGDLKNWLQQKGIRLD